MQENEKKKKALHALVSTNNYYNYEFILFTYKVFF